MGAQHGCDWPIIGGSGDQGGGDTARVSHCSRHCESTSTGSGVNECRGRAWPLGLGRGVRLVGVGSPYVGLACAVCLYCGFHACGLREGQVVCVLCADVNMQRGSGSSPGIWLGDPCAFQCGYVRS